MNKYLVPMLVVILFLSSSFIVASSPKDKSTIDDDWKYNFPPGFSDNLGYSKMTRFVDHYEKEYLRDDYMSEETMISEHPPILPDSYRDLHMWPMQGYNRQHVGRSPYNTEDNPGIEKWCFLAEDIRGSPVLGYDGTIYFGSGDGYFYALNPNSSEKWKYFVGSPIGEFGVSPAIAPDGTIYVTNAYDFGLFLAFNPNGTIKWQHYLGMIPYESSPVIGEDGMIYITPGQRIEAYYPNGTKKWSYTTNHVVQSSPAIGLDGTIYFGSHDTHLYALYPNGTLKWKYKTDNWVHGSPTIGPDGTVYVGSDDDYLYALYPENGTMKWKVSIGSGMRASPSIDKNGNLYFGVWENRIYSVAPNGTIRWSFNIGDQDGVWGSTAAISDDGTIYIGVCNNIEYGDGGEIVALNPDGTLKWREQISNYEVTSSPVIGSDGTVYIGSYYDFGENIGYLHAFGELDLNAPEAPTIIGETDGEARIEYEYTFSTIDPNEDNVYYYIEWSDGEYEDWFGPFASGDEVVVSHTWGEEGDYTIRARAKDTNNLWGPWGELEVTMPVNQPTYSFPLLQRLLERFPNAFPLLRNLLGF